MPFVSVWRRSDGGRRRHRDDAVPSFVLPTMPMAAALSAAHLSAILFPDTLRRLYIARDDDPAGDGAMATLIDRAQEARIEAIVLSPRLGDFNEDLRLLGLDALRAGAGADRAAGRRPLHGAGGIGRNREEAGGIAGPAAAGWSASLQGRRGPRPRPSERAIGRQAARTGNGGGRLFSVGGRAAFTSRNKIVGPSPSSADASALRFAAGAGPARPPPSSP